MNNKLRGTIQVLAVKALIWRPPQGDAPRHRRPDRRHRHQRGDRAQARFRHGRGLRFRLVAPSRPGTTRRSSTAAACRTRSRAEQLQIKAQIEENTSDYDREKLQERLAKLSGGVAVIKRWRGHRGRAEGEEAPHRGRSVDDPRGRRGGPRGRRRDDPAAGDPARLTSSSSTATRRSESTSSARHSRRPPDRSPTTPVPRRGRRREGLLGLDKGSSVSTATSSEKGSSTRPRSPAPPSRTPLPSPRWS